VWEAYHDTATFSSTHGVNLEAVVRPSEAPSMIFMDPPEHEVMRKLVSRAFTPRRISELEAHATELVDSYLDPFIGSDGFDFVEAFASRLAPMMIGHMLGVPEPERDMVRRWFDSMVDLAPGETRASTTAVMSRIALRRYATALAAERREQPRDDMVSVLVEAVVDDAGQTRGLTDEEVVSFILLLAGAGVETVARSLSWAAVILARHPDQRQLLVDDPSLIPNAFEEVLRFEAPSPVIGRWTFVPFEAHGVEIPVDSRVLLLVGSANRDPREFADPDRFDVRRSIKRHLSFGHGAHFCLGASLARMECRVALEGMLARFPSWDIVESELVPVQSTTVRGFSSVPVYLP
jgi:cytochrome P450